MPKPSIFFLLPYPLRIAPSQRFRVEAFFPVFASREVRWRTDSFFSETAYKQLYEQGAGWKKGLHFFLGFLKRLLVVFFVLPRYEYIVVHRGAAPLGPPIFEWLIAKVLRKKLVYDFDDAIWIPVISEHNKMALTLKCSWKVAYICKWAHRVIVGNEFLACFARKHNTSVVIIPTCVDTLERFNQLKKQQTNRLVIGWTGTHSTLSFLDPIVPILQRLEQNFDFDFLVICNQAPSFPLRSLRYLSWNEATEIADLSLINIGLMPLVDDAWSEGKCGFKIIQYLAIGIPAVASPVGVNKFIVDHGINGYLCSTPGEWYQALATLLNDESLRTTMGQEGRTKVVQQYSVAAYSETFLSLFCKANAKATPVGVSHS